MPEGNRRWSVPPRRFGATVVLTAIGVFIICGGVGKGDINVGGIGVAVVAVAAGIYVLSALNSRVVTHVSGTGHVVSASPPPSTDVYGRCTMQLLVTSRNMVGIPVKVRDLRVPLSKWPDAGTDLPVMVAVGGSRKVRVLWDEVPIHGTPQARAAAVRATRPTDYPEYEDDDPATARSTGAGSVDLDPPDFDPADFDPADFDPADFDAADVGFGDVGVGDLGLGDVGFSGADGPETDRTAFDSTVSGPTVIDPGEVSVAAEAGSARGDSAGTTNLRPSDDRGRGDDRRPATVKPAVPSPRAGNAWPDLPDVDPDGADEDEFLAALGVTETNGTLSIELEVSDLKASDPDAAPRPASAPQTDDVPSAAAAGGTGDPPATLPRRTPSPRPRMGVNQPTRTGVREEAQPVRTTGAVPGPTVDTPTVDTPTAATPTATSPTAMAHTVETSTVQTRASATPTAETPTVQTQASATPTTETPTVQTQASATPTVATPTVATPAVATPIGTPAVNAPPPPVKSRPITSPPAISAADGANGAAMDPRLIDRLLDDTAPGAPPVGTDALLRSADLGDSMPTVPIRFDQARVVSPGVAAAPDSDEFVFDQAADESSVAEAYIAATPPPGTGTAGGRIRSVAATLFVTDLSRSIVFYRDVLGFTEADAGRGSAVLVSGDAKIVLRRVGMAPVDRRLVQLLLEVPDVNAAYEDLRSRSVPFIHRPRKVGQYEQQTLWAAALRDPDGHGIAITQWRDRRS